MSFRIAALAAVVTFAFGAFAPAPADAQMGGGRPRVLSWAVPEEDRPAELRGASDVLAVNNIPLRLRAEIWLRARDCPPRRKDPACAPTEGVAGRVYVGGLWEDQPLPGYEIESLWLLRKGETWRADALQRRSDLQVDFSGGPVWPVMEPVDVVVRLRGVEGLLQLQLRTPYLKGR